MTLNRNIKKNIIALKKRKQFMGNEIFFNACSILTQTRYSNFLNYFIYKRRLTMSFHSILRNRCVNSGLARSVNSKFKLSRFMLTKGIDFGKVSGFHRSV